MRESHNIIARRVGARLKELRGRKTQAQFAAGLGLSQAQYNRYETGKRLAPDKLLEEVARLCGLSPEEVAFAPGAAAAAADAVDEVARLAARLDRRGLEDVRLFLKVKVGDMDEQRRKDDDRAPARPAEKKAGGI